MAKAEAAAPAPPSPVLCSSSVLAELLDCTTRQVEKYAEDGLVLKVSRGKYQQVASVRNVVRYLRRQAAQHTGSDGKDNAVDEKIQLTRVQRRLTEMRVQQMEGALISLPEIEDAWSVLVLANRQLIQSIPGRARLELPHLNGHDQKVLTQLCHDLLTETALGEGRRPSIAPGIAE